MQISKINSISTTGLFHKTNKSKSSSKKHSNALQTSVLLGGAFMSAGMPAQAAQAPNQYKPIPREEKPYVRFVDKNFDDSDVVVIRRELPTPPEPPRTLEGYTYMDDEGNIITANQNGITTKTTPDGTVIHYDPLTGEVKYITRSPEVLAPPIEAPEALEGYTYMDDEGNIITANQNGITTKTTPDGVVEYFNP